MEVIYIDNYQDKLPKLNKSSAIIGNFDGFHLGHQQLLNKAKNSDLKTMVITFRNLDKGSGYLTDTDDRIKILEDLGVDYLVILLFDNFKSVFYNEFITLLKKLKVTQITCGNDFRFGFKKEGDIIDLSNNFKVNILEDYMETDTKVSTSYIKELLDNNNIEEANKLLTRNYMIKGKVVKGSGIGHTIGFPTANIEYEKYHLPHIGAYYVKVKVDDIFYDGMASVGLNPSINLQDEIKLEVNLFNFNGSLYDKNLEVYFKRFLGKIIKFNSKEELISHLDILKKKCHEFMEEESGN